MDYDNFGAKLRAAYDVYALGLTGVYMGFKAAGRGADAVTELRQRGIGLMQALNNTATIVTTQYLAQYEDGEQYGARGAQLVAELHRVATKNLNDMVLKLMGLGLSRPADILTQPAGAIGLLLQQKLSRPHFTARDSAGRAWDASKLVSVIARDFAYQAYVDSALAREQGQVDIMYADPARNLTLTVDQAREQRPALFHVNATARIRTHVST